MIRFEGGTILKVLLPITVVLIMTLTCLQVVDAEEGMECFIVVPEPKDYVPGETAIVYVHVFFNGNYIDPDQAPILMIERGHLPEIETEMVSKGIYKGVIQINETMKDNYFSLRIELKTQFESENGKKICLTYGREDENDRSYSYVDQASIEIGDGGYTDNELCISRFSHEDSNLKIEYTIEDIVDYPWKVGDLLNINFTVLKNGTPTEPDYFYVRENCTKTQDTGIGTYTATIRINHSAGYMTVRAVAEMGNKRTESWIRFPSIYTVWLHYLSRTEQDKIPVEVCIADRNGIPIAGQELTIQGTTIYTNSSGKAFINADFDGTDDPVVFIGHDYRFSIPIREENSYLPPSLWSPRPESTKGYDFEMRPIGKSWSGQRTFEFYAFEDGKPMSSRNISYYLRSMFNDVIARGNAVTSNDGSFEVEADFPDFIPGTIIATFDIEVEAFDSGIEQNHTSFDGKGYDRFFWYYNDQLTQSLFLFNTPMDDSLDITMDPLRTGGRAFVNVGFEGDFNHGTVSLYHGDFGEALEREGSDWLDPFYDSFYGSILYNTRNGVEGCLILPEFLPPGEYSLIAMSFSRDNDLLSWSYKTVTVEKGSEDQQNITPENDAPKDLKINLPYIELKEGGDQIVTASFIDPNGDPANVTWYIDGIVVSKNVSFNLSLPEGTYNLTLRVTDSKGAFSEVWSIITVEAGSLPPIGSDPDRSPILWIVLGIFFVVIILLSTAIFVLRRANRKKSEVPSGSGSPVILEGPVRTGQLGSAEYVPWFGGDPDGLSDLKHEILSREVMTRHDLDGIRKRLKRRQRDGDLTETELDNIGCVLERIKEE